MSNVVKIISLTPPLCREKQNGKICYLEKIKDTNSSSQSDTEMFKFSVSILVKLDTVTNFMAITKSGYNGDINIIIKSTVHQFWRFPEQ